MKLEDSIAEFVAAALNVTSVEVVEVIQSLWGGQGQILRLKTNSKTRPTCVLKHISLNAQANHPRGWNTSTSFHRKAASYEVERLWYEQYARRCSDACKVPQLLGTESHNNQSYILLEDLSTRFPVRCETLTVSDASVCLEWLAHFHANFLGDDGNGLWDEGCYWHFKTRQDEFQSMPEGSLKQAANVLDEKLAGANFQTLVHGDAKLANFCFSDSLTCVAAVDFQYVGKGCGIRDVAYFLGSCLSEADCADYEETLLNMYFTCLRSSLSERLNSQEIDNIENEWRSLFGVAWTDFYRFLMGWLPAHPKINAYTLSLCDRTLSNL